MWYFSWILGAGLAATALLQPGLDPFAPRRVGHVIGGRPDQVDVVARLGPQQRPQAGQQQPMGEVAGRPQDHQGDRRRDGFVRVHRHG